MPTEDEELERARNGRPLLGCGFFTLAVIVLAVGAVVYVLWALFVGPDVPN